MIQMDRIKREIAVITDPIEMAMYLDGIREEASIYCEFYYPRQVKIEKGELKDVSVKGICRYLESEEQ